MKFYWNLKEKNYYFTAIELKKIIPSLKNTDTETLEHCLRSSDLRFYEEQRIKTPLWVRFTMPLALIFIISGLIFAPVKFMFTGDWGYQNEKVYNWLKSLGF